MRQLGSVPTKGRHVLNEGEDGFRERARAGRGGFGASGQGSLLARGGIYTQLRLSEASMGASGKERLQVARGRESVELEIQEKAGPCGWSRVKGVGKVGDEVRRAVRSEDSWPAPWQGVQILFTTALRNCWRVLGESAV